MKKNTLLYLDSDLVERAKRENINISKLAEEALKQALQIGRPRTAQEHLQKMLAEVGNENSFYGETYLLPFQIESLRLTKIGPFDKFEASFKANSLNVIYGSCGGGKSTLVRSILFAFGIKHRYFTSRVYANGKIQLELFPHQKSITITNIESCENTTRGYQCLIADDPLERLSKNIISPFFTELKRLKIQIIVTASPLIDKSTLPNSTHVISL
ncbi:MAG: type II toxin-antitoxin system CcdA family antitoxin [Candidatus Bathyarchaeia archaeon]